ncbi:MAG TPA: hypothetical protein VEW95_05375 [Candidatus Limnocylindrales bacterium]|nr:hypothetical protein [Candidatus Limnocylindrales bacterium]
MGVAFLVLLAIGALLHPDYQSNPLTWLLASLVFLGAIAIVYNKARDLQAREAIIELNERDKRR